MLTMWLGGNRARRLVLSPLLICLACWPTSVWPVPIEPAYDIYAKPGRLVRLPNGRRLNLRCGGAGNFTIVLESGLGFPSYSWRKVQPTLEKSTRTCSYDRAGLGFSDPGPLPRSAGAMADDLAMLLHAAGERPPYVLVANSLGSQPARLFAFRHSEQVAGMVLVDPYVEGQNRALARIERPPAGRDKRDRDAARTCLRLLLAQKLSEDEAVRRECVDAPDPAFSPALTDVVQRQRMGAAMVKASASELDTLETLSARQLKAEAHPLGAIPLIVLTAGDDFRGNPRERQLLAELRRLHRSLAALSTQGEERLVLGASHVIQSSTPSAVVAAVRETITR